MTHLVKLSPSGSGDKLAEELSHILPLVVKDKQEFIPASQIKHGISGGKLSLKYLTD